MKFYNIKSLAKNFFGNCVKLESAEYNIQKLNINIINPILDKIEKRIHLEGYRDILIKWFQKIWDDFKEAKK